MIIPRSNPTNVIFRNESDEHRRLSIDFGTQTIEIEDEEVIVRDQICTTLDRAGWRPTAHRRSRPADASRSTARSTRTARAAKPSDGYWFFVPGVDTAKLELIVP